MALSFKFPKLGKARSNEAPLTITEDAPLLQPRAATSTAEKSATQQMKKLGGIFALLLAVIAIFVVQDSRNATHATAYVAAAGEMRMLSQRLAKASSLALQGDPIAFAQLKESRVAFSDLMDCHPAFWSTATQIKSAMLPIATSKASAARTSSPASSSAWSTR